MDKIVISAQDLLEDSIALGIKVLESGFRPTMIIAIWRGGTPVGMALQEVLSYCGVRSDHIAIRTSSYVGVDERGKDKSIERPVYPDDPDDHSPVDVQGAWIDLTIDCIDDIS